MSVCDEGTGQTAAARWPGFDWDCFRGAQTLGRAPHIHSRVAQLQQRCTLTDAKTVPLAPPVLITQPFADRLERFCKSYHRMVETVVARYQGDPRLQRMISLPPALHAFAQRDQSRVDNRISLCRVDFYLDETGGFSVLETNANCPGGLVHNGLAARLWRTLLAGTTLPHPLA